VGSNDPLFAILKEVLLEEAHGGPATYSVDETPFRSSTGGPISTTGESFSWHTTVHRNLHLEAQYGSTHQ
jgi:hypothetical protein